MKRIKAEKWADEMLSKMTLEEKLRQLSSSFPNGNERLKIPHMQQGECLHGVVADYATSFPQALALGCTWDTGLIEKTASVIAKECRALGIHQCYGPMIAVSRDPRWGRIQESYGEDAYHVAQTGLAFINGLQGIDYEFLDENHIVATAKHYVADGEPLGGLNGAAMEISDRSLREVHLLPFEIAIKEGNVCSIMPAHHSLNGIPCHAHKYLIEDVARSEFGFDGHIVSDNGDIRKMHTSLFVTENAVDSAVLAMNAGVDTELAWMMPWGENRMFGPVLEQAVRMGKISEKRVDVSVKRVLVRKYEMNLFSDPTADAKQESLEKCYADKTDDAHVSMAGKSLYFGKKRDDWKDVCYDESHDALALEVANKSIVLLQNRNDSLPLNVTDIKKMAVIGPNADRLLLGNYATENPKYNVTVLEGIKNYSKGRFKVEYSQALDKDDYTEIDIAGAVETAKDADVTLVVLGGNEMTCMENQDTDDLSFKGDQQRLLEAVHAVSKKLVLVVLDGRPVSFEWAKENVDAILMGFFLGQETGTAVAMTLFGDNNPSGKLPLTIPKNVGQIQCHYNRYWPGRTPDYYKTEVAPLFAFGHGLSYTTFEITSPYVNEVFSFIENETMNVSVTVINTGNTKGTETVQLYIRDVTASLVRPVIELKRFKKVVLEPNEQTSVYFSLNVRDFAFWKDDKWVFEPGKFILYSGSDSVNLSSTEVFIE